jgi:hypothetical protein
VTRSDEFRFGIGSATQPRSTTWKLWTRKNDIYLACREMGRWLKVSLHASGDWRIAWVRDAKRSSTRDRIIERWARPAPFRERWTEGIVLAFPWVDMRAPLDWPNALKAPANVMWMPGPAPAHTLFISVLLYRGTFDRMGRLELVSNGDRLIEESLMTLERGERVLVALREQPQTAQDAQNIRDTLTSQVGGGALLLDGRPPKPTDNLFVHLMRIARGANGNPMIIATMISREHLGHSDML